MFLEQFADLLKSSVACDGLFVVGDLNVHFDNPSDPCTAALNVVLGNLSLEQSVYLPIVAAILFRLADQESCN